MTLPVPIATHIADALALMLSQFDLSERMRRLVTILATRVQELETWQQAVAAQLNDIDVAVGVQVDRHGKAPGELRGPFTVDSEFITVIKARGVANQSQTNHETLLRIVRLIAASADEIRLQQAGRAYFRLEIDVPALLSADLADAIVRLVLLAQPTGVGSTIVERDEVDGFRFDVGPGLDVGELGTRLGGTP